MINDNKALDYFIEHITSDDKLGKSIVPVKMYISYLKTDAKIYMPDTSSPNIKQVLKDNPETINGIEVTYELLAQDLVNRILTDRIIRENDKSLGIRIDDTLTIFQRTPNFISGNMIVTMLKSDERENQTCHHLSIGGVAVSGFTEKEAYELDFVQLYGPQASIGQEIITEKDILEATISFLDHLLLLEKRKRDILPSHSQAQILEEICKNDKCKNMN